MDLVLPSLTFAIPFYRGIPYLKRTLESILAQQDAEWDAIVCDDGSEDGVEAVVREYGGGRVRYERNRINLGMAGNFNRCIEVATTELVTVLHADDELAPTYCGTMREVAARHPHAAALFCRAQIIDEQSEPHFSLTDVIKDVLLHPSPKREFVLEGEPAVRALLKGNFIMAPTLCFRKRILGERRFPDGVKFVMDWELTTRLLLDGDQLIGVPQRCYRYRRHEENATSQYTRTQLRFREESEFYDRMQAKMRDRGWRDCEQLAMNKRIIKLNVGYRALKNAVLLDLDEARRGIRLLWDL